MPRPTFLKGALTFIATAGATLVASGAALAASSPTYHLTYIGADGSRSTKLCEPLCRTGLREFAAELRDRGAVGGVMATAGKLCRLEGESCFPIEPFHDLDPETFSDASITRHGMSELRRIGMVPAPGPFTFVKSDNLQPWKIVRLRGVQNTTVQEITWALDSTTGEPLDLSASDVKRFSRDPAASGRPGLVAIYTKHIIDRPLTAARARAARRSNAANARKRAALRRASQR